MSNMAGNAARVAVERSGSCRDTTNEDVIWRKVGKEEGERKN
jgi:hypothetical protein